MNLMEQWRSVAYNEATGKEKLQQLWAAYFQEEKEIYAQLLKNPDEVVKGTVKELADKYQVSLMTMTGFLDGINDSLVEKNPLDDLEEDTEVNLGFDKALLYKNMVAAEADWLYNLEEWNAIFDEETRKELYKEQKSSTTIVKEQKVYPNDPCPCGSGKKYKMGSNSYWCAVYSLRNRSTGDPGDHAEDTGVSDRYRTDRGRSHFYHLLSAQRCQRELLSQ